MIISNADINLINRAIDMEKKKNKHFVISKEVLGSTDDLLALSSDEIYFICVCLGNLVSAKDNFLADGLISKLLLFIDNKN